MGFRDDLDISKIVNQYEVLGGASTASVNYVLGDKKVDPAAALEHEAIPQSLYAPQPRSVDDPVLVDTGPPVFSTCTALMPDPVICWDANGYYRALGVHWKAGTKELRIAYQSLDGQSSVYLTYVMTQLLNKKVRRAYNRTPLGEPFLDDTYVQDAIKAKAAAEASRRTREGTFTTAEEVIAEEYNYIPEGSDEPLDSEPGSRHDPSLPSPVTGEDDWLYGYFLWRSATSDVARLAQWQAMLVRAAVEQGVTAHLAIGFAGRTPHQYVLGEVDGQRVVFLNEKDEPTEGLAASAITALLRDMN